VFPQFAFNRHPDLFQGVLWLFYVRSGTQPLSLALPQQFLGLLPPGFGRSSVLTRSSNSSRVGFEAMPVMKLI
jgi:hypothetical protein